jgi:hypothetical protein
VGRRRARRQDCGPAWKGRVQPEEVAALDTAASSALRRMVCAGFCTFFKEEPDEEVACAGLQALARLWTRGPLEAAHLVHASALLCGPVAPVDYRFDALLDRVLCSGCPFLPDAGCDHRNPHIPAAEALEPCGGYILVAALLGAGVLRVDDAGGLEVPE